MNDPMRRADLLRATQAEKAIREAISVCESTLPADARETDAIVLLGHALDRVADLVDDVASPRILVDFAPRPATTTGQKAGG